MAWLMDVSHRPSSPMFDFDHGPKVGPVPATFPEVNGRCFKFGLRYEGTPISPLSATQASAKVKRSTKLCDAFNIIGYRCFSDKLKLIIEGIEPGLHQFFPIQLKTRDGRYYDEKYYLFNVCTIIDPFVGAALVSGWPGWHSHAGEGEPYFSLAGHTWPVSSQEINGHHIWTGGFMGAGRLYTSNTLKKRLISEKIRYLRLQEMEEVNVDWHPDEQMPLAMEWLEADQSRIREMIDTQPHWVRRYRPKWLA